MQVGDLHRHFTFRLTTTRQYFDNLDAPTRPRLVVVASLKSTVCVVESDLTLPASLKLGFRQVLDALEQEPNPRSDPSDVARPFICIKQVIDEVVGEKLRSMMPWITANKLVDKSKN